MQKVLQKIAKNWITVWLIIAVLVFLSISAYAAYTRLTVAKRVISTGEGAGDMFASDMLLDSSLWSVKTVSYSNLSDTPNVPLEIFNFPYPKRTACAADDTVYDLTVTLGKLNNTNQFTDLSNEEITALSNNYKVQKGEGEIFTFGSTDEEDNRVVTHTFENCSITGGAFNSNLFTLIFDTDELTSATPNGYCIKLEAIPDDSELPTLRRVIMVKYIKTADSGWNGSLETLEDGTDYDAYNYIIKGDGSGKFTFTWDQSYVTINEKFLQNPDVTFYIGGRNVTGNDSLNEDALSTNAETGWKELTLVVNSREKNRYDVQFFKIDNSTPASYDNDDIAGYLPDSSRWQSN